MGKYYKIGNKLKYISLEIILIYKKNFIIEKLSLI